MLVRSPQVAPAMWRILRGFMMSHARGMCFDVIGDRAEGGGGGAAVDCARAATSVQRRIAYGGATLAAPAPGYSNSAL
eukprot:7032930-Pyramimonas_sp.AAC.1